MKVRELSSRGARIWPPHWDPPQLSAGASAVPQEGVLESVRPENGGLVLTMKYDEKSHVGVLRWDEPPTVTQVEDVLLRNLGREIWKIADVDV